MYTIQLLWLLSWPALIVVTYFLVKVALRKYEKMMEEEGE